MIYQVTSGIFPLGSFGFFYFELLISHPLRHGGGLGGMVRPIVALGKLKPCRPWMYTVLYSTFVYGVDL